MTFQPRPKQREVLAYRAGRMGVSAVPGSGKTHTLALLASQLVSGNAIGDEQEVLIVTLVNSAVDVFAARIGAAIRAQGLLPNVGYRVRTLHGLANDIVRERPALVGLADGFEVADERLSDQIRRGAVEAWVRSHPEGLEEYIAPDLEPSKLEWVRRDRWQEELNAIANSLIRQAKDLEMEPAELRQRLDGLQVQPLPLVEMGCAVFTDYQRALAYRGAVDFDDLVRLALRALQLDADLVQRLRNRWPYILEDEAQDSSRLQQSILQMLAGPEGNWVRVGDPNQAIYETFTTADPAYLRRFLGQPNVAARELPNSGRSTASIMRAANFLIEWTSSEHPIEALRGALAPPLIEPTPEGDPQPNPPDSPDSVVLVGRKFAPAGELDAVVESLARWLPDHSDWTVAALVPRNVRGTELGQRLKQAKLPYVELLRTTRSTREGAGTLGNVLSYLAEPASTAKLARLYQVWRRADRDDEQEKPALEAATRALKGCRQVEDFIWPRAGEDWLEALESHQDLGVLGPRLAEFRGLVRRWQEAVMLPIDQLILTIAQDLFREQAELALAHKLAGLLARAQRAHSGWGLLELAEELAVIARDKRRFLGLNSDDSGFEPQRYRGQVVVTTVHRAKGLEWDRVYLLSANNYDFPSAQAHDTFIAEKWFVRDRLNLEAEALAQLDALLDSDAVYDEGIATRRARLAYAAERIRLLYVGVTRARRELIVTWNSGQRGDCQPAVPLLALRTYWEGLQHPSDGDMGWEGPTSHGPEA